MSCFGAAYYSPSSAIGGRRPWRWWRAKCAGIAAAVGSRIRKSIKKGIDGRRRRRRRAASSVEHAQRGCCRQHRRRSFAPVYVDELYSHHHHPPKPLRRVLHDHDDAPTTSGDATKPPAPAPPAPHAAARATGGKGAARVDSADASRAPAHAGGAAAAATAAAGAGAAMRNVLLRSPGRASGVLGVVKGMGEVDLRAELFIRKFKEDMRLQSQRSAEEFQAMLARGL